MAGYCGHLQQNFEDGLSEIKNIYNIQSGLYGFFLMVVNSENPGLNHPQKNGIFSALNQLDILS